MAGESERATRKKRIDQALARDGYDAVHLASALLWQDAVGEAVTLATFDEPLRAAAAETGLPVWPETRRDADAGEGDAPSHHAG